MLKLKNRSMTNCQYSAHLEMLGWMLLIADAFARQECIMLAASG